jgi:hypothetical protein
MPESTMTLQGPIPIEYTITGDVILATPPNATIRIERETDDQARGSLAWEADTPINITVHRPHDRSLADEAAEVFAALYWSRANGAAQAGRAKANDPASLADGWYWKHSEATSDDELVPAPYPAGYNHGPYASIGDAYNAATPEAAGHFLVLLDAASGCLIRAHKPAGDAVFEPTEIAA